MAIRDIRLYGDPILKAPTRQVTEFGEALRETIDDMIDSMYAHDGLGLAANQIGIPSRIAVYDLGFVNGTDDEDILVMLNPEILEESGSQTGDEGCLSLPGISEVVERPNRVRIRAQDLGGETFEMTAEGLLARAFCHEMEHLDGKLFIENLSPSRLNGLSDRLKEIARDA